MSFFTIDTYEKVRTKIIRPKVTPRVNARRVIKTITAAYGDSLTEPSDDTVLALSFDGLPHDYEKESFVRRTGAISGGGRGYAGVLINHESGGQPDIMMLHAFAQAFDNTVLLIAVPEDAHLSDALWHNEIPFGLLLDGAYGSHALRRALAVYGLQRVWTHQPVYLINYMSEEVEWHESNNRPCVSLRRLTFPHELSCGGALPLRFWWVIEGSVPVYGQTHVRLALKHDGGFADIPLDDTAQVRLPGDHVFNRITRLPDLPAGEYSLRCGLFGSCGALPLAIDAVCENGFYELGSLHMDDVPRPELFNLWDDYYPEGYYPLEDPKLPY